MPISPLRLPVPNSGASKHTNNIAAVGIKPQLSRALYRVKVIETGYVLGSSRFLLFLSDGELRYSAEN